MQKKESTPLMSRRTFLGILGNGAVAAGLLAIDTEQSPKLDTDVVQPTELSEIAPEQKEVLINNSESFEAMTSGYAAWWTMSRTSIVFVDSQNIPVGPPVAFKDFIDDKVVDDNGVSKKVSYLYTPMAKDETGAYVVDNIAPEWSNYVAQLHAKKYGYNPDNLSRINVAEDFVQAMRQADEPELQAGILNGDIDTNLDIVNYFGSKPVRSFPHLTRRQYLEQKIVFQNPQLSSVMQQELRTLLPALCAKESKFNDDVVSASGARGVSQFMPATWEGLGLGVYGDSQPFVRQVEAMGLHCDNIVRELLSNEVSEYLEMCIVPLFADRTAFEKDFLIPCIINAYNPGAGTMRTAIKEFIKSHDVTDYAERYKGQAGKDVFFDLTKFARDSDVGLLAQYKDRSAEYVGYIYALRDVFVREQAAIQIASN